MSMPNPSSELQLHIIYEDEWIIVVDTPAGLLTMSTGKEGEVTAYSILRQYVQDQQRGRGRQRFVHREERNHDRRDRRIHNDWQRLFIVHRLDRDTSGVLIFAKDQQTKDILQDNWNEIVLTRRYIALVEGHPAQAEGTIQTYLFQDPISLMVRSSVKDNGGKIAITHYRTLKSNAEYSLLECELETGRKNQIRVHCQDLGCPIAGDRKYGAKSNPLARLGLHAECVCLIHPYKNEEFEFHSKLPRIFKRIKFD